MPFVKLGDLASREPMAGFVGRFIHSSTMTIVHWEVKAGARLPEHAHPHEQVSNLLKGEFEMTMADQTWRMTAGSVAIVPANAVHSGQALTDCRFIDVFHPTREDYR